jgi:hypothetical protein
MLGDTLVKQYRVQTAPVRDTDLLDHRVPVEGDLVLMLRGVEALVRRLDLSFLKPVDLVHETAIVGKRHQTRKAKHEWFQLSDAMLGADTYLVLFDSLLNLVCHFSKGRCPNLTLHSSGN